MSAFSVPKTMAIDAPLDRVCINVFIFWMQNMMVNVFGAVYQRGHLMCIDQTDLGRIPIKLTRTSARGLPFRTTDTGYNAVLKKF